MFIEQFQISNARKISDLKTPKENRLKDNRSNNG